MGVLECGHWPQPPLPLMMGSWLNRLGPAQMARTLSPTPYDNTATNFMSINFYSMHVACLLCLPYVHGLRFTTNAKTYHPIVAPCHPTIISNGGYMCLCKGITKAIKTYLLLSREQCLYFEHIGPISL